MVVYTPVYSELGTKLGAHVRIPLGVETDRQLAPSREGTSLNSEQLILRCSGEAWISVTPR